MSENTALAIFRVLILFGVYVAAYYLGKASGYRKGYDVGYKRGFLNGDAQARYDYLRYCALCERTREVTQ